MFWKKKKHNVELEQAVNEVLVEAFGGDIFEVNSKHIEAIIDKAKFSNSPLLIKFLKLNSKSYANDYSIYFESKESHVRHLVMKEACLCEQAHNRAISINNQTLEIQRKLELTEDFQLSTSADQTSLENEALDSFSKSLGKYTFNTGECKEYIKAYSEVESFWGTEEHKIIISKLKDVNFKVFDLVFELFDNDPVDLSPQLIKAGSYMAEEAKKATKSGWVKRGIVDISDKEWLSKKLKVGEIKEILKSKGLTAKGKKDDLLVTLTPSLSIDDLSNYIALRDVYKVNDDILSELEWIKVAKMYNYSNASVQLIQIHLNNMIDSFIDSEESKKVA